jgi:prevent-host-death family protein
MGTVTVNIHDAKTNLSALLVAVQAGDEVIIAKANKPIARLVPIEVRPAPRTFGRHKGGVSYIQDDFDAPLSADFLLGVDPA